MYNISKKFNLEYGHRVHLQKLNSKYSCDCECACRHFHGHSGICEVHLSSKKLTNSMVTDFKHLNFFKKWVDDTLDHKFLIDINDPIFKYEFTECPDLIDCKTHKVFDTSKIKYPENATDAEKDAIFEKYEGMIIVDFCPTSENICKWIYDFVKEEMKELAEVTKVEWWETAKSHCEYYETKK